MSSANSDQPKEDQMDTQNEENKGTIAEENGKSVEGEGNDKNGEENVDQNEESSSKPDKKMCTPAIKRLHRTLDQINVYSPSDAIMSPCSRNVNKSRRLQHPHTGVLRRAQKRVLEFSDEEMEEPQEQEQQQ